MIHVQGVLSVRSIHGSRGDFKVGRLTTEIGEFAVKDATLDQYDEGRYEGTFGVLQIFPSTYSTAGRTVIEVRAKIGSIALANIDELSPSDESVLTEPDPIESEAPPVTVAAAISDARTEASGTASSDDVASTAAVGPASENDESVLRDLFGEFWPLNESVKLDPTVDRAKFRIQRDTLKQLGYRFNPMGQVWVKG